jgi:hypothetical protein
VILLDIALQELPNHPIPCLTTHIKTLGFEKEQNSLRGVAIRVIVTADTVDQIMTECQTPKHRGSARLFVTELL